MKKTKKLLSLLLAMTMLLTVIPWSASLTAVAVTDDAAAVGELPELQPIDMLTGTTLESGPAHPHTTPRTVVLDTNEENPALPVHRLANYLQSRGILFPGDTVKFILKDNPDPNERYMYGGPAFYKNNEPYDLAPGDTWGPFEVVSTQVRGSSPSHNYLTEIKVIGDNPVMLKDGWAGGSGWAADTDGDGYAYHTYSVWCLDYIILPRYHRVIYEYPEGIDPDELIYPDNMPGLPEVIWAEDLSFSWPEMTGTLFTLPRPINEGYVFKDYGTKWGSTYNYEVSQVVSDGQECEQWRFFFSGAEDYSWRFENRKEGDEEGQPIVITVGIEKGNTVTIDANGGTIHGFDRFIYNFDSDYYRSLDLGEDQPERDGYVFDGYYDDAACTQLASANNSYDLYWGIKARFESLGVSHQTLYARWAPKDSKDIRSLNTSLSSMTYTGSAITQDPVIKDGDYTLQKDKDYKILSITDNTEVGTATMQIQGIGDNYRGVASKTFRITQKPLTMHITLDQDTFTYDGTEHKPAYTVSNDEGVPMTEGTDYTVSYYRNKAASTESYRAYAFVSLKMKNYSGSDVAYFTINPKQITPTVTLSCTTYTADGSYKTPAVTVKDGDTQLTTSDYTVQYSNNVDPGTATATVTLRGNYTGEKSVNYTLKAATATLTATIDPDYNPAYTSYYKYPAFTVKKGSKELIQNTDYEITYKDNHDVGQATAIISGLGQYAGATVTKHFDITPAAITSISNISDQQYTALPIEVYLSVYSENGYYLYEDRDFTATYENNVEIGTATVHVTAKGNYTGSLDATFNIIEPSKVVLKDAATGVVANTSWTSETRMEVDHLGKDAVTADIEGWEVADVYDVTLYWVSSGNKVTLSWRDTVYLNLPCDVTDPRVYCVEEDGSLTYLGGAYYMGYSRFRVNHFSKFVIMKESAKILMGDVDADGDVDNTDAILVKRYAMNWAGSADKIKNMAAGDLNGDDKVDNSDAILLKRCVMNWTGYRDKYCIYK